MTSSFPGFHKLKISPSGKLFIDEFSNLKLPRIIQIIDSQGQFVYKLLDAENPLAEYNIGETNLVKISSDDDLFS